MVPRFICASNATERICLMNIVPTSRATTSSSAVPTRAHSVSNFRTARRVFEGRIKTERQRTRGRLNSRTNASRQVCMAAYGEDEDLYSVLGVPKDADAKTLKQAYRKLALKYHPDVNKEPDANERFVRIKQAYSTLSDSTARGEYDRQQARKDYSGSGSSSSTSAGFGGGFDFGGFGTSPDDEPFYGIDDFFRDMEKDWKEAAKDGKTKSLWDELNELGEEFVEFLEESVEDTISAMAEETDWDEVFEKEMPKKGNAADKPPEQSLEEMLAQLKKDMGL